MNKIEKGEMTLLKRASIGTAGAFFLAVALVWTAASGARAEDKLVFEKEVYDLIDRKCSGCHFPDIADPLEGGLDMTSYANLMKGGEHGPAVIPGNAQDSLIMIMIDGRSDSPMPPPDDLKPLTRPQIKLIRDWIDGGALSDGSDPYGAETGKPAAKKVIATAAKRAAPKKSPRSVDDSLDGSSAFDESATASKSPVASAAFSPDGTLLARGGLHDVELLAVDPATGQAQLSATLGGHAEMVRCLAFSSDGSLLAAGGGLPGRSGEIKIWNVGDRTVATEIAAHDDNIFSVAFSPDGVLLASCGYDKLVKIFDVQTGEELHSLKDHVDAVFSVAFSPDGKYLASASGDRTVKLWDVATGRRLQTWSDSTGGLSTVAFSPSGDQVAAGGADKMIRIWEISNSDSDSFSQTSINAGKLLQSSFAHDEPILALIYARDGSRLYSTSEDQTIKAWDARTLAERQVFEAQSDWVSALALSRDGTHLAAGRFDSSLTIYRTADARALWGTNPVRRVASADAPEEEAESEKDDDERGEEPDETPGGRKKVTSLDIGIVMIEATIPPSIQSIEPDVAYPGKTVEVEIRGKNLAWAEPFFSIEGVTAEVLESEALEMPEIEQRRAKGTGAEIADNARPFRILLSVHVDEDVDPSRYELRFRTPEGVTNARRLRVLSKPDVEEDEPDDAAEDAQAIKTPSVVQGKIEKPGEVDRFRIEASEGQELVIALTDTRPSAHLRLLDSSGAAVATDDDFAHIARQRVGYRFTQAGAYTIEVFDRELRDDTSYRLHVGEFPWVTEAFPLGVRVAASAKIQTAGYNLGGKTEIAVDAPAEANTGETIDLEAGGPEVTPIQKRKIAVGAWEELFETEPNGNIDQAQLVPWPATINGRIDSDGDGRSEDIDHFRFRASAGDVIVIETMAARLGSPLDSVIEILDSAGQPVKRATVRPVARTRMTLAGRDSRSGGMRFESWTDFLVNDYVMVGSEILQIRRVPGYGDEDVSLKVNPDGSRKGFFGTTPEHHAVDESIYRVEIHEPGSSFAPNGMPIFDLYWRNDDAYFRGAPPGDSYLEFVAPADGEYTLRLSDVNGSGGSAFAYRLALRPLQPDFDIVLDPYWINVPRGGSVPLRVRARKLEGFEEPIDVWIEGLPEGFQGSRGTIIPGGRTVDLAISALAGAGSTPLDSEFTIKAVARRGAEDIEREATFGAITVGETGPDLVVSNDVNRIAIRPGEEAALEVRVERNNGFMDRAPISLLNLPFGVRVLDTGLNGILVREGDTHRSMKLFAEPWAEPRTVTIYTQARIETGSPVRMVFLGPPIELVIEGRGDGMEPLFPIGRETVLSGALR